MGHVPVGPGDWKEKSLQAWTCVTAASPFFGLSSSSVALSIRALLGTDSFGGECLQGDFSFFLFNFIFSSSPLVVCGWSSLNGAGLISLIKIGLLQASRGGGGKHRAASRLFPPFLPRHQPCWQSRENQASLSHSVTAPEGLPTIWGAQKQTCLVLFQGFFLFA